MAASPPDGTAARSAVLSHRVGVIGVGAVGTRAVRQLLASASLGVVVYDVDPARGRRVADAMGPSVTVARSVDELSDLPLVVLAQPTPHAELACRLVASATSVVSVTATDDDAAELLRVVTGEQVVVIGAGFAPGLSCLLARHAAASVDEIEEIAVARHGTGGPACARQHHDALAGWAPVWRDGRWITQRAGSGRELCWFPDPIGGRDCYRAETADPRLLHEAFPAVGRIGSRFSARRRDRLTAQLPMLRPPHPEGGLGAIRVEVRGTRAGTRAVEILGAIDRPAIAAGAVVAVAAEAILAGELPPGAYGLADARVPTERFLVDLARRGVRAARFTGASADEGSPTGSTAISGPEIL